MKKIVSRTLYFIFAYLGYAVAQFNLGNRYGNGEGVDQDYKQAVYWW